MAKICKMCKEDTFEEGLTTHWLRRHPEEYAKIREWSRGHFDRVMIPLVESMDYDDKEKEKWPDPEEEEF